MTEYRFRRGKPAGVDVTAEQARAELLRIRTAHGDKLDPRQVVEESRKPKAVLHPFFEWNDAVAGEEYRVWQARQLTRSIYIVRPEEDDAPAREGPAFFHIAPHDYQPQERVIERPDLFMLALQALHSKLAAAERAVRELQDLGQASADPDRAAALALAAQGFEAVKAAVALIK